jgi:pilus assembly protein CpaC
MRLSQVVAATSVACSALVSFPVVLTAQIEQLGPQPVIHKVQAASERLTMIANTSRTLTLEHKIPQLSVDNPDVIQVTPLSPNEISIRAAKSGVTQIHLWDENKQLYSIEVLVSGDARELAAILKEHFPRAAVKIRPLQNSVILSGYVDNPDDISEIVAIARDFYPEVQNHMKVGGVQQVVLKVKVMEVSRTKLRRMGVDFADIASTGSYVLSAPSGLLNAASVQTFSGAVAAGSTVSSGATATGQTIGLGIVDPNNAFFMFLDALKQNDLAKILAEPAVVTVSGRPANFNSGGEFPVLVPQSLGTVSIQYRPYGTEVEYVPRVLGNGMIHLEVRPRVSEIDPARSVTINNISVPALRVRTIDTAVEMRAGQTLAIAGLVQNRLSAQTKGIPYLMDMPYLGAMFRHTTDTSEEIELLIMVTPQLIEAVEPGQMPPCGPGQTTTQPGDGELFGKGLIEVPKICPPADMMNSGGMLPGPVQNGALPVPSETVPAPQVVPMTRVPTPPPSTGVYVPPAKSSPADSTPSVSQPTAPSSTPGPDAGVRLQPQNANLNQGTVTQLTPARTSATSVGFDRSGTNNRSNPQTQRSGTGTNSKTPPGFFGPVGYDVVK